MHDVAVQIVDRTGDEAGLDRAAVRFGAAAHDIGKMRFHGPGAQHEPAGQEMLLALGVARFAALHGRWRRAGATLEELPVTLAGNRREAGLEEQVAQAIASRCGDPVRAVFTRIAGDADARLAFQPRFPTPMI